MATIMHPVLTPFGYAQAQEALYSDSIIVHMNAVAVVVWVGYDIALTTSQEIDAMWRRRLTSIPSFMYFVTRYFGFIFLVYNAFTIISNRNTLLSCYVWGMLQAIGVQLLSLLVNGLLAFRVYAFYHGNTRMKRLILTLWILESTIEVAVTIWAKVMTGEPVPPPENLSISGCISDTAETPFLTILGWLVNIVYSVICFCLIAYRFLTVYFEECMTSGIAERFLYDGALLFILLCGSNVVNIVLLYAVPKSPLILIGFSWFIGAGSVASSRTILSLRGGLHDSKRSITEYRLSATVGGFTKSSAPWCSRHQNSPVAVLVLDPQPAVCTDSQGSSFYMQAKIGLRVGVESA